MTDTMSKLVAALKGFNNMHDVVTVALESTEDLLDIVDAIGAIADHVEEDADIDCEAYDSEPVVEARIKAKREAVTKLRLAAKALRMADIPK